MRGNIRTERVVITLQTPRGGAATNTALLLTLLYRATRIVGGAMCVKRTDSESHQTTEYTLNTPKRSATSASSTSDCDPG